MSSQAAGLLNDALPVCDAAWHAVCITAFKIFVLLILKADVLDDRYTTSAAEYCPPTSISCIDKKDKDKEWRRGEETGREGKGEYVWEIMK